MNNKEKSELQKEIVDSVLPSDSGRLILAPRTGKTKLAIDIIKRDKPKSILWVTPSAKLAEEDIPKEFETWRAKRYLKNLTTVTWASLDKLEGHFDLIILDEEQFITENNILPLLVNAVTYNRLLSMTGTPTKHIDKMKLYAKLDLNILVDLSVNDAVDMSILSDYSIKVIEVNMSEIKNIEAGNKKKRFMTSEKKQYEYLNKLTNIAMFGKRGDAQFRILNRMRYIKDSKSKIFATKFLLSRIKGRILMFCASIEQAEKLCEHTYHSKTDDTDYKKFQSGEIDRIAMVNAGGTGHTYKEIDHLILVQADSDKNGLTSQKICRTLLKQKDYKATIWIICLLDTQDEKWVNSTLNNFDRDKVEYLRFNNIKHKEEL